MDTLSDDDYDRISDIDMSTPDDQEEFTHRETPSSSPPSVSRLRRQAPSNRKTIPCTYNGCPKTFNRKARLEEHLRSHTNSRIFKCGHDGCGKDFLRETHLKHHVKSAHTNIRDYKCTWEGCDKSFATGTRLRRHFQAHEGQEKYRCRGYNGCNETFRKHETLKRHVLKVHEHMRPFPCPDKDFKTGKPCDQAFDTAEKLRAHQRSKHDSTKFSCTECLTNPNNRSLINVKTEDDRDGLNLSGYFATFSDLQAHISEFHPPSCPYCPTSFRTAKELTRHLEIQHGMIDPDSKQTEYFACSYPTCDRTFSKRGNLTVHVKTVHEKKKDFICGETEILLPEELINQGPFQVFGCGRAFTTKASLEDHVRTAHLGMISLQVERRNKRKAEKQAASFDDGTQEPKKRKPRKDKGVKKVSALATLTGILPPQPDEEPEDDEDNGYQTPGSTGQRCPRYGLGRARKARVPQKEVPASSDEEDNDDWNQLSGSMTLIGDRLYHNGEEYEYSDGPSPEDDMTGSGSYSKIVNGAMVGIDDEPFFDNFEHEPESIRGVLDPALLSL